MNIPRMAIVFATMTATCLAGVDAQAETLYREFNKSADSVDSRGIPRRVTPDYVTVVAPEVINVNLADLPKLGPWKPGDPVTTIPKRRGEPRIADPHPVNPTSGVDPLLARQQQAQGSRGPAGFTTPLVNIEGDRSGTNPHDANGEIGINYYVQAINGPGGTRYTFYDKTDGSVAAGPFTLSSLGSGACASGLGDPIVIFDEIASRWVLTEFSSVGNTLCVYVAQTADPIGGGYFGYAFTTPNFPDYPKYGVWSDAYYVGTNEASSALYAFDRANMLAGNAATAQRFTISDPGAFPFAMIPPVDHDGALPPPGGAPGIFIRHYDDEAHSPGSNDPSSDLLQIWEFTVDWGTPANSFISGPINIEIAEIDSDLCGFSAFACFPQPGTGTTLDPLREVVMNLPKYRNFGGYESIVGNLPTDVDGTDHGGVRWFELRRSPVRGVLGPWTLFQEGTYAPDVPGGSVDHRWMAGSAIDSSGNIAVGFDLSNNSNIYPSLTYDGRLVTDPPGVLTAGETTIVSGTASQTSSTRWGDYSSMSVDPVDGCTFWFTSNYGSTASAPTAATRIAAFRFDACGEPTFTLSADINELLACVESGADPLDEVTLNVGSVNDFTNTVSLAFNPALPPELMGTIIPDMVVPAIPPNNAAVNLTAQSGASPGDYVVTVEGTALDTDPRAVDLSINVADISPPAPDLLTPSDGALNVSPQPVFSWDAAAQAGSYQLEVATDAGFSDVILDETVAGTAFQPMSDLPTGTQLFWRVTPSNQCGPGDPSSVFEFTTQSAPGVCGPGSEPVLYFADDMEAGTNSWTHNAAMGSDTWELDDSDANSPENSWNADDVSDISDQRLVSPEIIVPPGQSPLTLQFWTRFDIEENQTSPPNCYDGAILEYSTNGGAEWIKIEDGRLLTLPYTGTVSGGFSSPIGGELAWCNTQDWVLSVVDIEGLGRAREDAGINYMFRFRLATDVSVGAGQWYIDDVAVQSCVQNQQTLPFSQGFEAPKIK